MTDTVPKATWWGTFQQVGAYVKRWKGDVDTASTLFTPAPTGTRIIEKPGELTQEQIAKELDTP